MGRVANNRTIPTVRGEDLPSLQKRRIDRILGTAENVRILEVLRDQATLGGRRTPRLRRLNPSEPTDLPVYNLVATLRHCGEP